MNEREVRLACQICDAPIIAYIDRAGPRQLTPICGYCWHRFHKPRANGLEQMQRQRELSAIYARFGAESA